MTENTAVPDTVSEARFVDAAGGIVSVAVWDKANLLFDSMDRGAGVLGLSQVSDGVVLPVPAIRLPDAALLGLAAPPFVRIGAFRVLLLVQGTRKSYCEAIDDILPITEQIFKVTSARVRCLLSGSSGEVSGLSEQASQITLVGYCDFKKIRQYRLDMETALVLASAVQIQVPNSAGVEGGGNCVVTVEDMQKLSEKQSAALKNIMGLEWKPV